MYKLGIDLGGTKIEGIILNEELDEVYRKRIATEQAGGYLHILERIKILYKDLTSFIHNAPHTIGIGTPGSISKKTGLLKNSNTLCLNNQPLLQELKTILNRDLSIENDANCFAMAEAIKGAGKGKNLVFGVIMGTGCGGGIVYKGEAFTGIQSIAGEWGHTTINPHGLKCYCGKRGCVETYISGGGIERQFFELTSLHVKAEKIVENFRKGEKNAEAIMNDFFENFGIALSNLINVLDPDVVVIGGGLSNIVELYTTGIERVNKYIFNDSLETPIVKNQCGDSAGVWGAALIGI